MTNNLTGLTALISSITALITAIATLILHLRSQANVKSQASSQQSPPANEVLTARETRAANRLSKSPRIRRPRSSKNNRPYSGT